MNIQTSKIDSQSYLDIENPKLIEEIIHLIQSKSILTEKQKIAIDEAIFSIENNEGIAHDLVKTRNRYSKYFK
jgi:hypothetical protein